MRVRRSSDNAEQDIGYTGAGELDADALLTFVGSGNGFVRTWYDQSGNGRNAAQTTAPDQPRIVSAGVVESMANKSSINFLGMTSAIGLVTPSLAGSQYLVSLVARQTTTSDSYPLINTAPTWAVQYQNSTSRLELYAGSGFYVSCPPSTLSAPHVFSGQFNGNSSQILVNGHLRGAGSVGTAAPGVVRIGSGYPGFVSTDFDGFISELILFPAVLTASQRLTLERNQMQAYGIELVTDGGFDSPSAWNTSTAAWQITGGKAVLNSAGSNQGLRQQINIPVGATATLGFDIDAISANGALAYVRIGAASTGVGTVDCLPSFGARPLGRNVGVFTNTTGSASVWLHFVSDSSARTATIDNVSVTLS